MRFDGPGPLRINAISQCPFQTEPGHYTLTVSDEGVERFSAEVDLGEGDYVFLVVYSGDDGHGAMAVPVELSPVADQKTRYIFVHAALDNMNSGLDIYTLDSPSPPAGEELVTADLPFGSAHTAELPIATRDFSYVPTGGDPLAENISPDSFLQDTMPANQVYMLAINCDSIPGGPGYCSNHTNASGHAMVIGPQ